MKNEQPGLFRFQLSQGSHTRKEKLDGHNINDFSWIHQSTKIVRQKITPNFWN